MTDPLRSPKLRPWHLDRSAVVYVRQSTPQQVIDHQESTARQYALADRAVALGWAPRSRHHHRRRPGQERPVDRGPARLPAAPGRGRPRPRRADPRPGDEPAGPLLQGLAPTAGAVRPLPRRSWPTPTALYDPTDHNDRLLLGLHGMMSEAELHVLKERMYQGKLNKARRGELLGMPPIGYVRLASGEWVIDPDEQVQATVRLIFDQFDREATLHGLLRYLVHHGVRIPVRPDGGPEPGRAGVAAAEPGDAAEPAAPPELRRGLPVRPPADRPAAQAAGPADHRQADPPAGGVPGADPRPAAGVHHLGPVPGQPGAARRPTGRGTTGPGAPRQGAVAAGRAAAVRAVRAADDRAVLGAEGSSQLQLHARRRPTTASRSARASPGRCSTSWSPAGSWRPSSRRRWRRAWRRWPRSSGSGPNWPGTGSCVASGPATRSIGRPGSTRRASRRTAWSAASWSGAGRRR